MLSGSTFLPVPRRPGEFFQELVFITVMFFYLNERKVLTNVFYMVCYCHGKVLRDMQEQGTFYGGTLR